MPLPYRPSPFPRQCPLNTVETSCHSPLPRRTERALGSASVLDLHRLSFGLIAQRRYEKARRASTLVGALLRRGEPFHLACTGTRRAQCLRAVGVVALSADWRSGLYAVDPRPGRAEPDSLTHRIFLTASGPSSTSPSTCWGEARSTLCARTGGTRAPGITK
jgi:hypothetical protein